MRSLMHYHIQLVLAQVILLCVQSHLSIYATEHKIEII